MQVSWLARLRSGAFSGFPNGSAFALRLQWRDRAGLEPASLFAALLRNIESILFALKVYHYGPECARTCAKKLPEVALRELQIHSD